MLGRNQVQGKVEIFDANGDQHVDYIEFALALGALCLANDTGAGAGAAAGGAGGALPPQFARCVFDMMDLNGDGYITRDELHSVLGMLLASNGAAPHAHDAVEIGSLFDAMDVRGAHCVPTQNDAAVGAANATAGADDRVTFEEFDSFIQRNSQPTQGWSRTLRGTTMPGHGDEFFTPRTGSD